MSTGVYVCSNASAKVDQYSFDPVAGQLAALSPASVNSQGSTAAWNNFGALTYDGAYCYVINPSASKISQFSVDGTGKLTALTPSSVAFTSSGTMSLAIHPNGGYAYATDGSTHVFQWSVGSNGQLAALTPSSVTLSGGAATQSIAIAQPMPGSYYLYVSDHTNNIIGQFSVGTNGTLTALSPASVGASTSTGYVVVDPTQRWVYATNNSGTISQYSITPTTGLLTAIASAPGGGGTLRGIAVDATGRWLYAVDSTNNTIRQYSINQTTGALTALSTLTIATGTAPYGICIDPTNSWVYVTDYNAAAGTTIHQYGIQGNGQLVALSTATVSMDTGGFWIWSAPQTSLLRQKMPIGIT